MTENKTPKSPHQRFEEIAPIRVTRVIKAIRSLSNCSSKNYQYTDVQVNKMISAINKELRICKDKFSTNGKKNSSEFTF